jgi:VWFA-related protein
VGIRLFAVASLVALGVVHQAPQQPPAQSPPQPQPQQQQDQQPQPQKPPVFRGGTQYVRVDAYPTRNGHVIEGLTAGDFELLEDGKPQDIAAADYVAFDELPDDDRGPNVTAREGLELASDSRYRVFVFVVEREAFNRELWRETRDAIDQFLESEVTPRDLLALITTDRSWSDLVIGKRLSELQRELDNPEWITPVLSEQSAVLLGCPSDGYESRIRADQTYALLEGLVRLLGQIREDRTSIVYVANGLNRQPPNKRLAEKRSLQMPAKMGIVNGRIGRVPQATDMHDEYCKNELRRLAETDYSHKFDDLITLARGSNVAFYPIAVPMLVPALPIPRGMPLPPGTPMQRVRVDGGLGMLAAGTDGLMIPADGNLGQGLQRMAQDVTAHYLLGYYSTNTKADGKIRTIKVRLKKDGSVVRARTFYRAPSSKDMKAMAAPARPGVAPIEAPPQVVAALDVLSHSRPSAQFNAYASLAGSTLTVVVEVPPAAVEAGRWSDGASLEVIADADNGDTAAMGRGRLPANGRALLRSPVTGPLQPSRVMVRLRATGESLVERLTLPEDRGKLIGDPVGYRSGPRGLALPVGIFEFARDEKVRLDWPLLGKVESVEARLLDRRGQALKHRINATLQQAADGGQAVTELAFNSLGRGDYIVELAATAAGATERRVVAFRVK